MVFLIVVEKASLIALIFVSMCFAIHVEGFRNVQARLPLLYREFCIKLCDRSILQLLKWIETYKLCRATLNREHTIARRGLLKAIKISYNDKEKVSQYRK